MIVMDQVPSGKGENKFGFGGSVQDTQFAQEVTTATVLINFLL